MRHCTIFSDTVNAILYDYDDLFDWTVWPVRGVGDFPIVVIA